MEHLTLFPNQKKSIIRLFAILVGSIFFIEAGIMEFLSHLRIPLPPMWGALLDALMLVVLLFPMLYLLVLKPLFFQVDEMKRIEASLAQSYREWEDTFDTISDMITIHDRDLNLVKANKAAGPLLSLIRDGAFQSRCMSLFSRDTTCHAVCDVVQTGRPCSTEMFIPDQQLYLDVRGIPQFDKEHRVTGVIHVVRDITYRKYAELALQESVARYRSIFENAVEGIFRCSADGKLVDVNPAFVRMFGYDSEDEVLLLWLPDLQSDSARWSDLVDQFENAGTSDDLEISCRKKNGEQIFVIFKGRAMHGANGRLAFYEGMAIDITRRKRAKDALRESEARLADAQRIARIGTWVWDMDRNDMWCSDEFYRIFGVVKQDTHVDYHEFIRSVHPDDRKYIDGNPGDILAHGLDMWEKEYRILLPAGEVRFVHEIDRVLSDAAGTPAKLMGTVQDITVRKLGEQALEQAYATLEERRNFVESIVANIQSGIIVVDLSMAITLANPFAARLCGDDSTILKGAALCDVSPELYGAIASGMDVGEMPITLCSTTICAGFKRFDLRSADGTLCGHIVTFVDLTEIIKIRQEMQLKERLATMGEVVARVAHEMRNPLFGISAVAQILLMELELSPPQLVLMNSLLAEGRRMNTLVEELLDCSREMKLNRQLFDLKQNIGECMDIAAVFMEERRVTVRTDLPEDDVLLDADPARIKQVMLNILKNAVDATPRGGVIDLFMARETGTVSVSVRDAGPGIPEDAMDRIFDLFYTTKKRGTGLGLYICRKIVEAHGGILVAENRDPGACFTLRMPLTGDDA